MHHNDRVSSRYDDAPHEHYQQNAACRGEIVHSAALGRNAEEHSTTIHYRGHTNNWAESRMRRQALDGWIDFKNKTIAPICRTTPASKPEAMVGEAHNPPDVRY
jgi:hypothetical protein